MPHLGREESSFKNGLFIFGLTLKHHGSMQYKIFSKMIV